MDKFDHRYLYNIGAHSHIDIDEFIDNFNNSDSQWTQESNYIYPNNNTRLSVGNSDDLTRPTLYIATSVTDGGGIGAPSYGVVGLFVDATRPVGSTYTYQPNKFYYESQELLDYQDVNTGFYTYCNASTGGGSGSTTFALWNMCVGPTGGTGRVFGQEINIEERRGIQDHLNTGAGYVPSMSSIGLALVTETGFGPGDTSTPYTGEVAYTGAHCSAALGIFHSAFTPPSGGYVPKWRTGVFIGRDAIVPTFWDSEVAYQNEAIYLGGAEDADNDAIGIFFDNYHHTGLYMLPATFNDNYAIVLDDAHRILWSDGETYTFLHRIDTDLYWWDGTSDILVGGSSGALWTDNTTYISPDNWSDFKIFDSGYVSIGSSVELHDSGVSSLTLDDLTWIPVNSYWVLKKNIDNTGITTEVDAFSIVYNTKGSGGNEGELGTGEIVAAFFGMKEDWNNSPNSGDLSILQLVNRGGGEGDNSGLLINQAMNFILDTTYKAASNLIESQVEIYYENSATLSGKIRAQIGGVVPDGPYGFGYLAQAGNGCTALDMRAFWAMSLDVDTEWEAAFSALWCKCQYGLDVAGAVASIGGIRMANNQAFVCRNYADNNDLNVLFLNTSNVVVLGNAASGVSSSTPFTAADTLAAQHQILFSTYTNSSPTSGDFWFNGTHWYARIGSTSYQIDQQSTGAGYLLIADIDDAPVNNETSAPISSNWAYDHVSAADPHTVYRLESADHTHQSTGAEAGQLDHGAALTGLTDDDHSQYALLEGRSGHTSFTTSSLRLDNAYGQYWKNNAGTYKLMFFVDSNDVLNIGTDLGAGKILINIDGAMKVLSVDGSGFVKATSEE